ncbi:DUF2591 domain-containing protein [Rosenbergiella epipactidis]|uniref:DUF2591 domain-containing protein n=1 Tax=Rosenbergiella epipactidis TaxID=1544694 RepID=UPI001F4DB2E0|nr:DUF2591 domain-containing protein [Rosenbergiella epipactidis]
MNYQEMSDEQIEFAVSDALGIPRGDKWCSDWCVTGDLMNEEKISIAFDGDEYEPQQNVWCMASTPCGHVYYGDERYPRRAICIAFLMMKGGE